MSLLDYEAIEAKLPTAALENVWRANQADKTKLPIPGVTYVVSIKRHHVRFFPRKEDADRTGNCRAGTVVDRDIVHPTELDFYLQSHAGLLGTSRPAHYNVLYDDNAFS